jgi:hypothetical protein
MIKYKSSIHMFMDILVAHSLQNMFLLNSWLGVDFELVVLQVQHLIIEACVNLHVATIKTLQSIDDFIR